MGNQLYWEDVNVDDEITPLEKVATTQALVRWAGASGDFNPLHYDSAFAKAGGLDGIIVTGQLKRAWLVQMLTDWIGEHGKIKKLTCRFRVVDYPRTMATVSEPGEGETWWCKGKVTKKSVEDDKHCVNCNVWVENGHGETTTAVRATVILPSRG